MAWSYSSLAPSHRYERPIGIVSGQDNNCDSTEGANEMWHGFNYAVRETDDSYGNVNSTLCGNICQHQAYRLVNGNVVSCLHILSRSRENVCIFVHRVCIFDFLTEQWNIWLEKIFRKSTKSGCWPTENLTFNEIGIQTKFKACFCCFWKGCVTR